MAQKITRLTPGMRVIAVRTVTEGGKRSNQRGWEDGNNAGYVHARKGDIGEVVDMPSDEHVEHVHFPGSPSVVMVRARRSNEVRAISCSAGKHCTHPEGEAGNLWTCERCDRVFHWMCNGAADDGPEICDACWTVEHANKKDE